MLVDQTEAKFSQMDSDDQGGRFNLTAAILPAYVPPQTSRTLSNPPCNPHIRPTVHRFPWKKKMENEI